MKRALGFVAAVACIAVAGGCAGQDEGESGNAVPLPETMPLCADQFQEGKTIEVPDFGRACRTATDDLAVPRYVSLDCADDRTLVWNDRAWGYVGGPMSLFEASDAVRVPTDEAMSCRERVTSASVPDAP